MRVAHGVPVALVALAGLVAWTARVPAEGAAWRTTCVAAMLAWGALALVRPGALSTRGVLTVAAVLRLIVFPMEPSLSDDAFRYLWDGLVQAHTSPYALTPREALGLGMPAELLARLNSPDTHSVYPPASQALFRLAAASGDAWWWVWKACLVGAEAVGLGVLARRVPARALALYAWHPVAVVEIAGQGHTEGLAVGAVLVALAAAGRSGARSAVGGALAFAVATWTKLTPVGLGAALPRRGRGRWLAAAVAATAALAAPVAHPDALANALGALRLYAGVFDWYHAPYLAAKAVLHLVAGDAAGLVVARVFVLAWLGVVAWTALVDDGSERRLHAGAFAVLAGAALLSPTLHPWHGLLALAVVPLVPGGRWMAVLLAVAPGTYLAYVGFPTSYDLSVIAGWFLTLWALTLGERKGLQRLMAARGRAKWARIAPALGPLRPGARLLDLGAGEGYVGAAAAEAHGAAVTLADVARYGSPARPVVPLGPGPLPFADAAVDATLVVFVLHHAHDPEGLLAEALRVTRGPVAVLETVWDRPWKKRPLEALDRAVNRLRSGGRMDAHVDIRSADHWEALARRLGARVEARRAFGTFHPQALLILRRA